MENNMFCFQCEQTAGCGGCTGRAGVCGKQADTAQLQEMCIRDSLHMAHIHQSCIQQAYEMRKVYNCLK